MALQPRSAATRFRACPSRARGTLDKSTTPPTANNSWTPRTVKRAREGSVRAPYCVHGQTREGARRARHRARASGTPRARPCAFYRGHRWAVSATLVRLKGKVELRVSGHICLSNRGALATSLRAGHSRAKWTLDKPGTPECANDIWTPRRVKRARVQASERRPVRSDKP